MNEKQKQGQDDPKTLIAGSEDPNSSINHIYIVRIGHSSWILTQRPSMGVM